MPNRGEEPEDWLRLETRTESDGGLPAPEVLTAGLTILCHPDARRIGERAALTGLGAGRPEGLARDRPLFAHPGQALRRPLADPHLSRQPIELAPAAAGGGVRLRRGDSRTTVMVAGEAVTGERELVAAEVARGVPILLAQRVALLLSILEPLADARPRFGLIGDSPAMVRLRRELARVADLDVPVLLRGETGTGKELAARALHQGGPRARRPFVAVNMAAIPPALAAAELFGAARGAYTGAERARQGFFGAALGGTLFLDEIGETPPEIQVLLLRALENREIQPVGSAETRAVDVRLVAATDASLEAAVAAGRFRAPLLHRLSGYEIRLPALRERREDIGRLLVQFLDAELRAIGAAERLQEGAEPGHRPWLPAALVARLAEHSWPGNVRQLQNVARQLAIGSRDAAEAALGEAGERLLAMDLHPPADTRAATITSPASMPGAEPAAAPAGCGTTGRSVAAPADRDTPGRSAARRPYRRVEDVSDEELLAALRANRWRLLPTAALLGVARASLYARIESAPGFRKAADLSRDEIDRAWASCGGSLDRMAATLEVSKPGLLRRMKHLGLPDGRAPRPPRAP